MTPEDYVSYDLALALKKAGFDWPCGKWIASKSFSYYDEDECCDHNAVIEKGWLISQKQKEKYDQEALPYLTLWQAQKWLREKKRIVIVVTPETDMADFNDIPKEFLTGEWCYEIWVDDDTHRYGMESHSSYEQALSAGIEAALELIEKKGA